MCANLGVNALDFRLMTWILEIKCPSTIVCSNNFLNVVENVGRFLDDFLALFFEAI